MENCKIEWLTVPAPNLEAAKQFYEHVFGFQISKFSERFWVFQSGSLSGGLDASLSAGEKDVGIGFSITVNSISDALAKIRKYGGSVVGDMYSLGPGNGFCAQFKDPNGNVLELYSNVSD